MTAAPEPVELALGLVVATLENGAGGPQGDKDQRHVDEERRAPTDRLDQEPAQERAQDHGGRGARCPQADCASPLLAVERGGDDRQAARDEKGAECALDQAGEDEHLHVRRQTAGHRGHPEAGQADAEHAPASVEVADPAGQDEEGGEDSQIAAVDVGQAFDASDERRRQLAADRLDRDIHDRSVQEHDRRTEDDRQQRAESCAHRDILRRPRSATGALARCVLPAGVP